MTIDKSQPFLLQRKIIILAIFMSLVASCLPTSTPLPQTSGPPSPAATPAPSVTPTLTPTVNKILFLSTDQISQVSSIDFLLSSLNQLAQSQGWEVLTVNNLPSQGIAPGTQLVVAVSNDPGFEELVMEKPEVQFLAIGIPGLTPSANLSLIGPDGFREDRIAFMAGYLSAVLTKDWRIGLIHQSSLDLTDKLQGSFTNGMVYYCGLCRLTYPPFYNYPIFAELPEGASESNWENAAQILISQAVETAFIFSNDIDLSTLDNLIDNEVLLIGIQTPPDTYSNSWLSTIRNAPEQAIENHWDDLVSGNGGWVEEIPIVLDDINVSLFSPGRQAWVQETVEDLVNGFIATGYAQ